jgi:hypothetical protein
MYQIPAIILRGATPTQLDRKNVTMPGIMTKVLSSMSVIVAMSSMSAIMAMIKAIVAMSGMSAIMAMANSIVAMSPWSSIVAMVKSLLGPQGETASVVTPLNIELAEKEERSELIARHEDEKDKIRAAAMRQEDLLSLVRHEMAALGANVNDRMQMMTRNTLRMADCNAQLIMATRAVVEQNQVSATPGKLNPSPLLHAPP